MRIYELANELHVHASELLFQAKNLNLEVRSPLSKLDADEEETLRSGFKAKISFEIADAERARREKAAAKQEIVKALYTESFEAEKTSLEAAAARAEEIRTAFEAETPPPAPAPVPASPVPSAPAAEAPAAPAEAPRTDSTAAELAAALTNGAAEKPAEEPAAETEEPAEGDGEDEEAHAEESEKPAPSAAAERAAPVRPAYHSGFDFNDDEEEDEEDFYGRGRRARTPAGGRDARGTGRDARKGGAKGGRDARRPAPAPVVAAGAGKHVSFQGPVKVKDLASTLGLRPNVVIAELMKLGTFASINQVIDATAAEKVAVQHGFRIDSGTQRQRNKDLNKPVLRDESADDAIPEDSLSDLVERPPVVTFLGHVDHGKTSLMDRIRSAHVAAGEAGGITQHISAYTLEVQGRPLTFLDTPGHAAFSAMRARGAHLTDIAVIIIAADDGIMPQTKEAIRAAKDAGVTIMVAINKIDKPEANVMRVQQQLQGEGLTPEDWGGDTVVCPVSAVSGEGVDNLLDMIFLQAEMLELRANPNRRANGSIIEAQMEPGRGPIATVLVTGGTLKVGDAVLCGEHYGKLRALITSTGTRVRTAGPSQAVQIVGLSGVPEAGAEFQVMPNDKRAKIRAEEYAEAKKVEELTKATSTATSISDIFAKMRSAEKLTLRLVLRADVQGSVEAIVGSINEIKSEKVSVEILHTGTGSITSNDVQSAGTGDMAALIIGFNVSSESGVQAEAHHNGVRIRTFRIIYELLDFIRDEMLALLPAEYKEVVRGHATVKQIFALNRMGNVAGCAVDDGQMISNAQARVLRKKQVVHSGPFESIRHYQNEVKEVAAGQECGIRLTNFELFQEGDIIECFNFEEMPKSL